MIGIDKRLQNNKKEKIPITERVTPIPYFIEPIKRIGYGEMDLVSKRGLSMIVVIPLYLVLLFIFNKFYSKDKRTKPLVEV